ncbi:MAG: (2Fe-2S)-binding protein [Bacteroidetes bacterium 4572_77]|nr:MAG: (2Fe-2S)-binding protein [Bacteroidetes bacterium 4572_77]
MFNLKINVNNKDYELKIDESMRLLDVLREELGLLGTKEGCGEGECGACTVIMDGRSVESCLILAAQCEGKKIITIEGLENENGELDDIQKSFLKHGAVQCGFCTPGMVMSAKALLDKNENPTEDEIKESISGNLCRCTGYSKIITSIEDVAKLRQNSHLKEEGVDNE